MVVDGRKRRRDLRAFRRVVVDEHERVEAQLERRPRSRLSAPTSVANPRRTRRSRRARASCSGCARTVRVRRRRSFFDATASRTPRPRSAQKIVLKCGERLARLGRGPRRSPSGPSSPTTPPHSVLSRSTTMQRGASPTSPASTAAVSRASGGSAAWAYGWRAAYQRRGSNQRPLPMPAAIRSTSTRRTLDAAASPSRRFSSRTSVNRLPGSRAARWPNGDSSGTTKPWCTTRAPDDPLQRPPQGLPPSELGTDSGVWVVAQCGEREVERGRRHEDVRRREACERRVRREGLLLELPERRHVYVAPDAERAAGHAEVARRVRPTRTSRGRRAGSPASAEGPSRPRRRRRARGVRDSTWRGRRREGVAA